MSICFNDFASGNIPEDDCVLISSQNIPIRAEINSIGIQAVTEASNPFACGHIPKLDFTIPSSTKILW